MAKQRPGAGLRSFYPNSFKIEPETTVSILTAYPYLLVMDLPVSKCDIRRAQDKVDFEVACECIVDYLHKPLIPGHAFDLTVEHLVNTQRPQTDSEHDWLRIYFRELIYALYHSFKSQGFYVCGRLPYEYARLRPGHRLLLKRKTHLL